MTQAGHSTESLFITMATGSQGTLPSNASFPPTSSLQPHQHTMITTPLIGQHTAPTVSGPVNASLFQMTSSTAVPTANPDLPTSTAGDSDIGSHTVC